MRTNVIIGESVRGQTEEVAARMPAVETLRRDVRRRRHKKGRFPELPRDANFAIPQRYAETDDGERFLQVDSNVGGRMLLFGTDRTVAFLEQAQHWFMDGTFSSVPHQVCLSLRQQVEIYSYYLLRLMHIRKHNNVKRFYVSPIEMYCTKWIMQDYDVK